MNPSLVLAAFCLGMASAAPTLDDGLDAQWNRWKAKHRKSYGTNEEGWRRAVWEKNVKRIEQHNREYREGKHGFTMAVNAFGDMTNDEYNQRMKGSRYQKHEKGKVFQEPPFSYVPPSFDWRKEGFVTPVKDQYECDSGWAFSATGALEGQMFWKTGKLVALSEQNLVDCSRTQGNAGCKGGRADYAFQYVKKNGGLDSEASYPYTGKEADCKYKPEYSAGNDTGFIDIPVCEKSLVTAVAIVGPMSVAIDASHESFQFYEEGVYYEPDCSSENLNHALLLVGYGYEGAKPDENKYWIAKNSWGTDWGKYGYIKMARDRENNCGIASAASYPIL
ncbi:cathepsin L1-like [Carlito syrichta]|uniref:Cathepsin L1-like n=1 Tax=Carlito syrichta TaxID=1868482 RepID=A0A1U7UIB0_CARSF|nr:cathepsin L1-like [Carlito syrichta]